MRNLFWTAAIFFLVGILFANSRFHPGIPAMIPMALLLLICLGAAIHLTRPRQPQQKAETLQRIQANLEDLLENTTDLILSTAPDGSILYANRAWREALGIAPEEVSGLALFPLLRSDCRTPFREIFDRLLQGETIEKLETVFRTRDGRDVVVEGRVYFRFDRGEPTACRGIFRNITDHRRAEDHLKTMVENAALGMVKATSDGAILQVNRAFCDFLGYDREELLKRTFADITSPEGRQKARDIFDHACSETDRVFDFEHKFLRKDGAAAWGHTTLTWVKEGETFSNYGIAWVQDVTLRKRNEGKISQLAYFDGLTGLPNRTLFFDRLTQAIARAKRDQTRIGLLFLDLDQFKRINDTLGHAIGDEVLKLVAERLKSCVRQSDTVARLGGDEFVFLLPEIKSERNATLVAHHILDHLTLPHRVDNRELYCAASIGIAFYPEDGHDADTLLKNGDMAMYEAKAKGRNTCLFFSEEMNRKAVERLDLETRLRTAVRNNEFSIVYQPQVDLKNSRVVGVEALVRWRHPEEGMIGPGTFIPVAEETGLILPIGHWILQTACAQFKSWQQAGLPLQRVAVNVSGLQLGNPNFVTQVEEVLEKTGLAPQCLELELTENIFMKNIQETIMDLTDLKVLGVNLAIDDFGTGYSSLNYLKNFLVDRIKIAQDFVRDISADKGNAAIVETIIAMAHNLNLNVIAEGVETREQVEFLHLRNCHEMQGYFFGKPMEAKEFTQWLEQRKTQAVGF